LDRLLLGMSETSDKYQAGLALRNYRRVVRQTSPTELRGQQTPDALPEKFSS